MFIILDELFWADPLPLHQIAIFSFSHQKLALLSKCIAFSGSVYPSPTQGPPRELMGRNHARSALWKLFCKRNFNTLICKEPKEKTTIFSKIMRVSWQHRVQKLEIFQYYTEEKKSFEYHCHFGEQKHTFKSIRLFIRRHVHICAHERQSVADSKESDRPRIYLL